MSNGNQGTSASPSAKKSPDFGAVAGEYAQVRAGFPTEFFVRLTGFGIGCPGQRILDLGTGTGTVALGLARRGAEVTALDVSQQMLDVVQARAADQGVTVASVCAPSHATGLPDESFDVIIAGQCWHWLDQEATLAEVRRLLRPGGRLVIAYLDWIPLPGSAGAVTQEAMLGFVPGWPYADNTAFYDFMWRDAASAGLRHHESFGFDLTIPYDRAAWVTRVCASGPVMSALTPDKVTEFGVALEEAIAAFSPDPAELLQVPHRVVAMIADDPRPRTAAITTPSRWRGEVAEINIAGEHSAEMLPVESAELIANIGLEGDRVAARMKRGKEKSDPYRALTLIETEALDQLRNEYGVELTAAESRRSIATRGVPLNHLIGKRFMVGDAVCRGSELCEPCGHLQKLTRDGVLKGLIHRGGIRAYVEHGATIRPGDAIVPID